MTGIVKMITGKYNPLQAIIVYGFDGSYYLESRPIKEGIMGEAAPLQKETIADIVEYFAKENKRETTIKGAIPSNLLFCEWNESNKVLVWFNTPQKRFMHFVPKLEIQKGEAWQPALIYVLRNGELSLFATSPTIRPNEETILYQAPYHNVFNDGRVCLGSSSVKKPKESTYANWIAHYEHLFWGSEFSHLAGNESPIIGNLNSYWKAAIKSKKPFDYSVLLAPNKYDEHEPTFESLLKSISK